MNLTQYIKTIMLFNDWNWVHSLLLTKYRQKNNWMMLVVDIPLKWIHSLWCQITRNMWACTKTTSLVLWFKYTISYQISLWDKKNEICREITESAAPFFFRCLSVWQCLKKDGMSLRQDMHQKTLFWTMHGRNFILGAYNTLDQKIRKMQKFT